MVTAFGKNCHHIFAVSTPFYAAGDRGDSTFDFIFDKIIFNLYITLLILILLNKDFFLAKEFQNTVTSVTSAVFSRFYGVLWVTVLWKRCHPAVTHCHLVFCYFTCFSVFDIILLQSRPK
ncbi:MAG: hypothetical protein WBK46_18790 [Ruminococcus flavefaciens]